MQVVNLLLERAVLETNAGGPPKITISLPSDDILGMCFVEIVGASDLPKWKNMTRLSFDMDPFVIIAFGHKIFRTSVVRHSLNPNWNERLWFQVRRHEAGHNLLFSVYDWDKVSSNDFVGGLLFGFENFIRSRSETR